jgi:hypothetical protein
MIIKTALLTAFVIFSMGASCNKNKTDESSDIARMDDSVPEPETPAEDSYNSYSDDSEYPAENSEEPSTESNYDYQEDSSESAEDSSY